MIFSEFLRDLAQVIEVDADLLQDNFSLSTLATRDSLSFVSTIGLIDNYFKVQVDGGELTKCKTIKDIFSLIEARKMP